MFQNSKRGPGEHESFRDPGVSRSDWCLGCNGSERLEQKSGVPGRVLRDGCGRGDKGKRKSFSLDVPSVMCLENIGESMWGWSSGARPGNRELRTSASR